MAVVDQSDHALVLGIVYDGPPEAGKTTSVRALARSFGRDVYTPEESHGRTVYFDWLEHTGGRFDGAPIRCQIVSVPGQPRWLHRRAHLLERADVVVFVGDTGARAWPSTLERLRDLERRLKARSKLPVGIVFQANRRDAPDAVPIGLVREQVGSEGVTVIESVALDGTGVREAFVFAVRLALDRVREEQRLGALPQLSVEAAGTALLAQLQALDQGAPLRPAPLTRSEHRLEPTPANVSDPPLPPPEPAPQRLPSHEVASGLVWPPVQGRILLREAMTGETRPQLGPAGDYSAVLASGHRAHSPSRAHFAELEPGRELLIGWARRHAACQALLSRARCIVLSGAAHEGYRLWQVVRSEPSLRELFVEGCDSMIPRHAARQLATASRLLSEAQAFCEQHDANLPCTLDTIGVSELGQAVYVGDFPFAREGTAAAPLVEQLASELSRVLLQRSAEERIELYRELRVLQHRELVPGQGTRIAELLSQLIAP